MRKTRDLFKKIRETKGTFHAKMGSIKDRNCMDLREAKDIKQKWQEYWSGVPLPSLISYKNGLNKGQKWYGNSSRRY